MNNIYALLCESEKREHFNLTLGLNSFAKNWYIFSCIQVLLQFSQSFSAKTKCKVEFPDYSSCGLIMSKLNQSVYAQFGSHSKNSKNLPDKVNLLAIEELWKIVTSSKGTQMDSIFDSVRCNLFRFGSQRLWRFF